MSPSSPKTVGILSFQGDFALHLRMLESLDVKTRLVRTPDDLAQVDAVIIPGGESTTIGKLMWRFDVAVPLKQRIVDGMPVFGTCAGLILLSRMTDDKLEYRLAVLDVEVERNAYGRQVDSFEADFTVSALGDDPIRGVFIRAPIIRSVGAGVETIASFESKPVLVRQGSILGASFHPELTTDTRVHELFLSF